MTNIAVESRTYRRGIRSQKFEKGYSKIDHRKHRSQLVDSSKKQPNRIFIHKKVAIKVIMDCRTTAAHNFKQGFGRKKNENHDKLSFVIKNLKNSRCANLLANRKSYLLFILSQSKVDM